MIRFLHFCHSLILISIFSICFIGLYSECEAGNGYLKYSEAASKLARKGEHEKAITVLNFGIQKYRNSGALYYQRAVLKQDWFHKYGEAIQDYTAKLMIDKKKRAGYAKVYYRRAVCFYKIHNYKLSLKDFNTAISLSPRYDKAYFSRAKVYAKIGLIEKARLDLEKCRTVSPHMTKATHVLMNKILLGKGEF